MIMMTVTTAQEREIDRSIDRERESQTTRDPVRPFVVTLRKDFPGRVGRKDTQTSEDVLNPSFNRTPIDGFSLILTTRSISSSTSLSVVNSTFCIPVWLKANPVGDERNDRCSAVVHHTDPKIVNTHTHVPTPVQLHPSP